MEKNYNYVINSLKKMRYALYSLYIIKKKKAFGIITKSIKS